MLVKFPICLIFLNKKSANFCFLHCVTIYPTQLEQLHLSRMEKLKQYNNHIGFSDHTKPADTNLIASKLAISLGASCIERHFTILPKDKTKDGVVSLNPKELKLLCDISKKPKKEINEYIKENIKEFDQLKGLKKRELSSDELLNRDYYRGRFASLRKSSQNGKNMIYAKNKGHSISGIDTCQGLIKVCKDKGLNVQHGNAINQTYVGGIFDFCMSI